MSNEEQLPVKLKGTARAPESVIQALWEIIRFYWDEEFAHYSSVPRERKGSRHIFQSLNTVRRWLLRVDTSETKSGKA